MNTRTTKTIHWILLAVFSLFFLFDGIGSILRQPSGVELFAKLGYPAYMLTIIGIAKVIGVLSLLQRKFPALREWAYAGFIIDFIGASASFAFVTHKAGDIAFPLVLGLLLMYIRSLDRKLQKANS
jgi:hypothetical protein